MWFFFVLMLRGNHLQTSCAAGQDSFNISVWLDFFPISSGSSNKYDSFFTFLPWIRRFLFCYISHHVPYWFWIFQLHISTTKRHSKDGFWFRRTNIGSALGQFQSSNLFFYYYLRWRVSIYFFSLSRQSEFVQFPHIFFCVCSGSRSNSYKIKSPHV